MKLVKQLMYVLQTRIRFLAMPPEMRNDCFFEINFQIFPDFQKYRLYLEIQFQFHGDKKTLFIYGKQCKTDI